MTSPASNLFVKILDYFFLLRPTLWFPLWILVLAGKGDYTYHAASYKLWLLNIAICGLFAILFLLNQIKDTETDEINDKLHYIASGIISKRAAWIYSYILIISSIIGVIAFGHAYLWATLFSLFLIAGILYSVVPSAWKDQGVPSFLVQFISGYILLAIGQSLRQTSFDPEWIKWTSYASAFGATAILTMVPDIKGDLAAGKITYAVKFGKRGTGVTALILVIIAILGSIWIGEIPLLIAAGASFIPFLLFTLYLTDRFVFMAIKVSIGLLAITVGIWYEPILLILLVLYFVVARIYFEKRFRLKYPSLSWNA